MSNEITIKNEKSILIKAGSYFLITHTQMEFESGEQYTLHVFMRQIEIGFAKNVMLWLDDN